MTNTLANTNSPFAAYRSSDIFFPVSKRSLAGQHRDQGFTLPIDGFQGVFRSLNGQPTCLGVVKDGYNPLPMKQITDTVERALIDALPTEALKDFDVRDVTGRDGSFVKREYRFRALAQPIEYGGRYGLKSLKDTTGIDTGTTVAFLTSIATSYDGSSSIRLGTGGEDLVCQNGLVMATDVDAIARRHTKNAGLAVERFAEIIAGAVTKFTAKCELWQDWARKDVEVEAAEAAIRRLPGISERRATALIGQAHREFAARGLNVYSVMSALTYYSSHAETDGTFAARNTGNDNVAETLVRRNDEVNRWLKSEPFLALAA